MRLLFYAFLTAAALCTAPFGLEAAPFGLDAAPLQLKAKFQHAEIGDYVVTAQDQNYSLLFIRDLTEDHLVLEEVTVPEEQIDVKGILWQEWLSAKAPGHTSWTLYEIDLRSGKLIETFSYSKKGWLYLDENQQLLTKLLLLPLQKLPDAERRKIGPPPAAGESDQRALWNPPLVFAGKKRVKPHYEVWKTRWPNDGSQLAHCEIELYFASEEPAFPFPQWVEVQSPHYAFKLRAVDGGAKLHSPFFGGVPHRLPQFVCPAKKSKEGLFLTVLAPVYYQTLNLLALDLSTEDPTPLSVPCEIQRGAEETLQLHVRTQDMQRLFASGHRYQWVLTSEKESFFITSENIWTYEQGRQQ